MLQVAQIESERVAQIEQDCLAQINRNKHLVRRVNAANYGKLHLPWKSTRPTLDAFLCILELHLCILGAIRVFSFTFYTKSCHNDLRVYMYVFARGANTKFGANCEDTTNEV